MNLSNKNWVIVCFVLLTMVFGCKSDSPSENTKILRIQINNAPDIINPALSRLSVSSYIEDMTAVPIALWDEDIHGWQAILVQSYHPRMTAEGVEYPLISRSEAHWSDGQRITTADLTYTIKMGLNPFISHQSWAAYLDLISGMQVKGDTLVLSMDTPYILADEFIAGLSPYPSHILDPDHVINSIPFDRFKTGNFSALQKSRLQKLATAFNGFGMPEQWPEPVSGLFHVSSWSPEQSITLARVDEFWGNGVEEVRNFYDTNIDTLQYVYIPDPQNALHAFTSGAIDVLNTIDGRDSSLLASFSGGIHEVPTLQLYYVAVNHLDPLLSQQVIRKALNMAINRQDIVHRLFQGNGQPAYGPIHPDKSYYASIPFSFSPDSARTLLVKAGCKDTDGDGIIECPENGNLKEMTFHIWTTRSQISRNVATLIKGYWNSIGVNLEIQSADFRTFLPELQNKTFDFATLALRQNNLLDDPYPLWHSSQSDATGKNYQGLASDSVDIVLEKLRQSLLPADQKRYYRRLQELFAEQVPVFFLVAPDDIVGVRDGLDLHWSSQRPGYDLLQSKIKR